MRRVHTLLLLCLWLLLGHLSVAHALGQGYSSLPEMGDRSTTILGADLSERIGRAMMGQLQSANKISTDPLVEDYIQRLGKNLAAGGLVGDQHFHFFVVNERSINAFAMPGGYIGVHAGLILASHSENELAAVMAHEIAHVTQHHIARSVERAKQMDLPLTAAVIAAILLGASDPAMGNAALMAALGAGQQMQIDFTRANEKEADRVGMQLLASAGFDPRGMADFFLRLQQEQHHASGGIPEFLRTHPITTDRMAEAQERASRFPPVERQDSLSYQLVKARLLLQHSSNLSSLASQVDEQDPRLRLGSQARRYLRGLIHLHEREYEQARAHFFALIEDDEQRIAYVDALARVELADRRPQQAAEHYRRALEYYPHNELLTMGLAESLLVGDQAEQARRQLQRFLSQRSEHSPRLFRLLAQVEATLGNHAASHIALAEYYLLRNEPHSALDQLQIAQRQQPLEEYHAARIDARLEQVKSQLAERER